MFRNDDPTAVAVQPAVPAPTGTTPGYFTNGNPASGLPATVVPDWWLTQVQEELLAFLTAAGITAVKGMNNQVLTAAQNLFRSGRFIGRQFFVNSGSYTPTPGTGLIKVRMVGGGGGGGGTQAVGNTSSAAGSGGASGGYIEFDLAIGALTLPIPITIGSGGLGQSGASGLTGGTTTFGTLGTAVYAACGGGAGGSVGPAVPSGSGAQVGASTGGTYSFAGVLAVIAQLGNNGYDGIVFPNGSGTPINLPALGAGSDMGSGGGNSNAGNGGNGTGYGAGGGGGGSSPPSPGAQSGGNGSQGYVLIEEFSA